MPEPHSVKHSVSLQLDKAERKRALQLGAGESPARPAALDPALLLRELLVPVQAQTSAMARAPLRDLYENSAEPVHLRQRAFAGHPSPMTRNRGSVAPTARPIFSLDWLGKGHDLLNLYGKRHRQMIHSASARFSALCENLESRLSKSFCATLR